MHFRECLIESEGKILLVFLISRKSIKVVDDVEVYQLDTAKLTWIKKESLGGDRTLFLGANCWRDQVLESRRSKCNPNPAPPWLQLTIDDQETADNQPCTFNIWFAKDPVVYAASSSNPKSEKWIKKDSSIIDPNCSDPHERAHLLRFTNGIWFKDKFYALSLHGTLAVIEDIDSDIRITAFGKKRAVPSVSSMHFRECLIESEGKILLVFLISRKSIKVVDEVEVYQLDTAKLTWIKKESLGE
ncbi:hypothetical protein GH714_028728 [Hevea brasiliensis]|uniref:KIB1-4 beta-propeller domain-containing protein n=1 Tax=Hevea brasiliensis TaxID=3981 RepID=A0A6A6N4K8_HEVBR|nr:hypothetical protein GH714_028728 [Hevea brasiliensis]